MTQNNSLNPTIIDFIIQCYNYLKQKNQGSWAFIDLSNMVWHPTMHEKNKELFFSIIHDALAFELIKYEDIIELNNFSSDKNNKFTDSFFNFYSKFVKKINTSHEYTNFLEQKIKNLENRFGIVWKNQEEEFLKIISEDEIILGTGKFLINKEFYFVSESKDKKKKTIKNSMNKEFVITRKRGDSFMYFCKELNQLFLLYSVLGKINIYSFQEEHYSKYYPILMKKGKIYGFGDVKDNLLIEGDNYFALQLLQFTHKGKIDVIYIDPPYNTGNGDFKYNDSYVGSDDASRHSKWLSFMDKRLRLGKELLSDTGLIFISINENEHAHFKILCDSIFNSNNFIGDIIWINSAGGNTESNFILNHEHILIYKKNTGQLLGDLKDLSDYKNLDNDFNGDWTISDPTKPDYIKEYDYPIENPYTGQVDYCSKTRSWVFPKETFEELKKEINTKHNRSFGLFWHKDIKKGRRGFFMKRYKNQLKNIERQSFSSVIHSFTNKEGKEKKLLTGLGKKDLKLLNLEIKFTYPKPTILIKKLLSQIKHNSIILDFFAGSGTTAHAILELNKEDGGNRKFILCTNNENNICEDVTYSRLERLNNPSKFNLDIEPLPHGLQYLQIKHISDFILELADDIGNFEHIKHINNIKFESTKTILENDFIYLTDKYSVFKKTIKNKQKEYQDYFHLSIENNITNLIFVCSDKVEFEYFKTVIHKHIKQLPSNYLFDKIKIYQMSKNYIEHMISIINGEQQIEVDKFMNEIELKNGEQE